VDYVFLTVFADGVIGPCVGATQELAPEPMLERLAARALADPRSAGMAKAERFAVELTFLHARLDTGPISFEDAARYCRLGLDAMGVAQGERSAILLPAVAAHLDLSREAFLSALLEKAGIDTAPAAFSVWRTAGWLDDGEQIWPVSGTFPQATTPPPGQATADALEQLLTDYLLRNLEPDGRLPTHYEPFQDRLIDGDELERQAFVAWILMQMTSAPEAAREPARRLLERLEGCLPTMDRRGVSGAAMLLCARCEEGASRGKLDPLFKRLQTHPLDGGMDTGHVLVALAKARAQGLQTDPARVASGLRRLRHRFRHDPLLGEAVLPWAVLAHAAWAAEADTAARTAFVREAVDAALGLQSADGGFQTTTQEDAPGCTTAPMLEALAASLTLTDSLTTAWREKVRAAFDRGVGFLDGLIYQERDAGVLPNPGFAEGGLRYSHRRATVRIDFVAHALHALLLAKRTR
jgi:hypothetical protein